MTTEANNKELVIQLFEEVVDRENFDLADQILAPGFASYFPSSAPPMSREDVKGFIKAIHASFPDMHHQVDEVITAGDRVIVRYTARGTHLGLYRGLQPTGKRVTVTNISIYRIQDGRVIEEYAEGDFAGLMDQLRRPP